MSVQDNRPSEKDIADWTQRRNELAARLDEFEYTPGDVWLRDLSIRHTGPMAAASKALKSGVPANDNLAAAMEAADRHLNNNVLAVEKQAEADLAQLRDLMKGCVAAIDAWIAAHKG
ncbi:hypothetical protein [Hoeflea sp.]|uniref:hypothetical protein n=1 Tax=Hoeflea sp. TaxID=1940281 RepID=UPI003B014D14